MVARRRSSVRKAPKNDEVSSQNHGLEEMEKMLQNSSDTEESEPEMESSKDDMSPSSEDESDVKDDQDEIDSIEEEEEDDKMSDDENNEIKSDDHELEHEVNFGDIEGEKCTLDLRNLLAINSHQVNSSALYKSRKSDNNPCTIESKDFKISTNESHLLNLATDGCAQLITGLWQLETEKTDAGPLAILPTQFETKLPRELVSRKLSLSFLSILKYDLESCFHFSNFGYKMEFNIVLKL